MEMWSCDRGIGEEQPGESAGEATSGGNTGVGLGRERASATVFSRPGTCTIELVNYMPGVSVDEQTRAENS